MVSRLVEIFWVIVAAADSAAESVKRASLSRDVTLAIDVWSARRLNFWEKNLSICIVEGV